ncbi:MAG: carbohydrate binding family 9 domain-containing protein [Gemmatimonadetes bacterium]|nr:carbohydrate binding family 9 domain-containing protein [Gemmatimonadota bacterium]
MKTIQCAFVAGTLAVSSMLSAQEPPLTEASRIESAPVIDGRLDDGAWSGLSALSGFTQREPSEGRPVSQATEVRIGYDADALYIGAWLFDEDPSGIVVGQTLRDASLNDSDAFVVVLDTYLDRQNAFVFGTTPAGIEYDGQVAGEGVGGGAGGGRQQRGSAGGFNLNWDGSWEVATSRDELGWYAEIRIPFSTVRYGAGGAQRWGLNLERRIRRNNEQSTWAPLPRQFNAYRISLAGTMALSAPAKRTVSFSPYVLMDGFRDYQVASPETDYGSRIGGDAKIGLNQSLTLDLTVNTDFAQAEVDDQQVNLTRFSLFFPEKRAFFLENAGTFAVGASRSAELFFSRRIGLSEGQEIPIQAGARMTGKIGDFQIGLLNIQTSDVFAPDEETGIEEQVAPDNNFGVLRAFKEFGNRTRLGGMLVSRLNTSDTDDYNLTYGIDGRLGVGEALTLDGWASLTSTPVATGEDPDGSGFNDGEYGFAGGLRYVTRDWQVSAGYRQIGDAFNPEVGFVNRRDYRHVNFRVLRHLRVESVPWFRELRPHISGNVFWSLDGFNESYIYHFDNHFAFETGAFFQRPGFNLTGEGLEEPFEIREGIIIPPGTYENVDWEFRANTNRGAPLSFSAGWDLGGFYNGTRFGPNATVAYRYSDKLTANLRLDYFDVRLDQGDFTTAVARLNASYSFTPRLYLQANVQYNDDTEDVSSNVRLGWLDTAGTGLFIVYNDTNHRGSLERTGIVAGPKQRQLVIKYSKLFDFTR